LNKKNVGQGLDFVMGNWLEWMFGPLWFSIGRSYVSTGCLTLVLEKRWDVIARERAS